MKPKILMLACLVACLLAGSVFGAVGGKITGTVTDVKTNEPLVGVSVSVMGTTMGAKTDIGGKYIIINVPVGTYTLVFSSVGYGKVDVENVHVSVDLATFQDQSLSSEVTDLGKTVTVRAKRPLVNKDKTTSVSIVEREQLLAMPTRGFEQVVGIQNSVVRMNSNVDVRQRGAREASSATAPEINLRGGRPSEVAYYVDGFSQQDPLSGISTANINNNAIKEVSVTSGAFSAEYGHVASGIVNVTTNSGTDAYHGNVELVSDNVATPFGYESYDQNWYSGDLSGPVPGLKKAYFFVSGERRFLADRSPSKMTKQVYDQFGLSTLFENPQRMPNNALSGWSYQAKFDVDVMQNMRLSLSGNGSVDKWQEYRHYYMNPSFPNQIEHSPRYDDKNLGLNAKVTHTLNPETFYNLSLSYFVTERLRADGVLLDQYDKYERWLVASDSVDTNRDGIKDIFRTDSIIASNPEYDFENLFRQGDSVFANAFPFFVDSLEGDPDVDTFVRYDESYWPGFLHRKSSYVGLKGDITRQLNIHNTLKFGFDFQRHTVRYFENLNATQNQTQEFVTERLNRYGYDLYGNESDNQGFKNDTKHPINLGFYLQHRLDWRGFIVNAGLRFDYFDYKALRLKNLKRPFDPGFTGNSELDRSDLENSKKFKRLSPRLGIAFPVSDKTQLYMNYGKFFQRPDLLNLYSGYDFLQKRVTAGSYYPFPSPNLEPEKTTQYEFGLTHQLGANTAFEVTAYYKDVTDLTQIFTQTGVVPKQYNFYANTDYGTIKGFDFNLTMRRTRNIAIDLKYSLSYASGTGSYSQTQFNVAWKNALGMPKQTAPLDFDQRHSLIGIFDLRTGRQEGPQIGSWYPFENFGLNTIVQLASGTPYTPTRVYDAVSPNASVQQIPTGSINSANLPWNFVIDMKMERSFAIGAYKIVPYLMIKNLLNAENETSVYEGTGKGDVSGYLETPEGQVRASDQNIGSTGRAQGDEFAYRYQLGQFNPKNYSNPRIILLGVRMSF